MSKALLNIAERAAKDAAKIILQGFDNLSSVNVNQKSPNDFVSEVDIAAEKAIINSIKKTRPQDFIVTEESGELSYELVKQKAQPDQVVWIIDPIDGTRNFIMGNPHYAISIAATINGKVEAALVYSPQNDEMFTAVRGSGAFLNGRRLRVDQDASSSLEGKIVATGYPFKEPEKFEKQFAIIKKLFAEAKIADIRRAGSAALDLCYVASRRYDAYFELVISSWDIAAGTLILQEAGGLVHDLSLGLDFLDEGKGILATNTFESATELSVIYKSTLDN